MAEQVPPHIPGNPRAVLVKGVLLHILEDTPAKPYAQKTEQQEFQFPDIPTHDHVVHHMRRQTWRHHIQ